MANSKKFEMTKKDMNFFSAFTSSAGQAGSYMSLALLILLGFLIIGGGMYAVIFFQTSIISSNIYSLNAKMQSESYQSDLAKYTEITNKLAELNQQYYDVSSLFSQVANKEKIDSKYMDAIYAGLPSDVIITKFNYTDGSIILTGGADSYYSPLDMIANFTKAKLFSSVGITNISQVDSGSLAATQADFNKIKKFQFTIQCSLHSIYPVVVSRFADDAAATPLTAVTNQLLTVGEQYKESAINTFALEDGTLYTLSRVLINNTAPTDAEMAAIRQGDVITGLVTGAIDIKLFYTLSSANGGVQG